MVIDMHTHAFPDAVADKALARLSQASHLRPYTDGLAASLVRSMRKAGIARSVVLPVATSPHQCATINRVAMEINRNTAETGLVSFAGIHPDCEDWESQLYGIAELGFHGIKLHPVYQGVPADDPRTLRLLRLAQSLGLCVVMHAGPDISMPGRDASDVIRIRRMLDAVTPARLVLAHMGGWSQWDEVAAHIAGLPGVWLDTAFCLETAPGAACLSASDFVSLVRMHGAGRVLFGTDSPWTDQKRSLDQIGSSGLTEAELQMILSENAVQLLGL